MNSYEDLVQVLNNLGFADFYHDNIHNVQSCVDFGKRKGKIQFSSIKSAAQQYTYDSSDKYVVNIDLQFNNLEFTSNSELILQCIEIFDWGGVQNSNIINAINLHREGMLKSSLLRWKDWFENDDDLSIDSEVAIWSSGWTKVFSFMFELTAMYDSRVAAYINYIFIKFFQSLDTPEQKEALTSVTKFLISFGGTATRSRRLNTEFRGLLKMRSPRVERNLQANKVASWFMRYLCQLEYGEVTQENFRQVDKAMFMLGFDINQIDTTAPFK